MGYGYFSHFEEEKEFSTFFAISEKQIIFFMHQQKVAFFLSNRFFTQDETELMMLTQVLVMVDA